MRVVFTLAGCLTVVALVDVPMTTSDTQKNVGRRRRHARMDKETLTELTFLFDRAANTLGTIAPVLLLAKDENATEKRRLLRAIVVLAFRGHQALRAFSQKWALVIEENEKRMLPPRMEDYADIFQTVRQKTILNPLPG
jgi:hypothetical protein